MKLIKEARKWPLLIYYKIVAKQRKENPAVM